MTTEVKLLSSPINSGGNSGATAVGLTRLCAVCRSPAGLKHCSKCSYAVCEKKECTSDFDPSCCSLCSKILLEKCRFCGDACRVKCDLCKGVACPPNLSCERDKSPWVGCRTTKEPWGWHSTAKCEFCNIQICYACKDQIAHGNSSSWGTRSDYSRCYVRSCVACILNGNYLKPRKGGIFTPLPTNKEMRWYPNWNEWQIGWHDKPMVFES